MITKNELLDILKGLTVYLFSLAGTITLAWDANTEPDLAGYRIHYGLSSGNYSDIVDMKDVDRTSSCPAPYDPFKTECCEVTLIGFELGKTYYFAATAYDEDNNESAYSEELVHTFNGDTKLKIPGGMRRID
jgi:hypothetical protein